MLAKSTNFLLFRLLFVWYKFINFSSQILYILCASMIHETKSLINIAALPESYKNIYHENKSNNALLRIVKAKTT